ncbi:hypothetical protein [Candidatus Magnetobacterium casense]|nr:hypothetical protein [Candidatus Magnetobacterium casensis]
MKRVKKAQGKEKKAEKDPFKLHKGRKKDDSKYIYNYPVEKW